VKRPPNYEGLFDLLDCFVLFRGVKKLIAWRCRSCCAYLAPVQDVLFLGQPDLLGQADAVQIGEGSPGPLRFR